MGEITSQTGNLVQSFLDAQFPRSADSEPNLNHAAIAAIAESGLADIVVTTNFDECLDKIWRGTIVVPTDAFAPPNATPALVKVHGTISDFSTVAVNPDALAKRSRVSWQASLASLLRGRRVLFVGYGFQDRFDLTPALIQAERDGAEFFWANQSFPPTLPLATMSTIDHDLSDPNRNLLLALCPNAPSKTSPARWPSNEEQEASVTSTLRGLADQPSLAERLKAFASLYYWLEDGKRSLRLFRAARSADATSVDTHALARAFLRARRYRRAVFLFDRMLNTELPTDPDERLDKTIDWHCGAAHCAAAGGRVLTAQKHYELANESLRSSGKAAAELDPYLMDQLLRGRAGNLIRLAARSWSFRERDELLSAAEVDLVLLASQIDRLELRVQYLMKRDLARIQLIRGNSSDAVRGFGEVKEFFEYWGDPDGLTVAMRDLAAAGKVGGFRSLAPAAAEARKRGRWLEWIKIEATRVGLTGYGPLAPAQARIRNAAIAIWDAIKEMLLSTWEFALGRRP